MGAQGSLWRADLGIYCVPPSPHHSIYYYLPLSLSDFPSRLGTSESRDLVQQVSASQSRQYPARGGVKNVSRVNTEWLESLLSKWKQGGDLAR